MATPQHKIPALTERYEEVLFAPGSFLLFLFLIIELLPEYLYISFGKERKKEMYLSYRKIILRPTVQNSHKGFLLSANGLAPDIFHSVTISLLY